MASPTAPKFQHLPIDEVLPELVARVREHGVTVLAAETGAGKTTRVPPALLDAGLAGTKRLVMLEPRRIAARAAARRIALERGVRLGDEVGYHVRFDRRAGRDTRLLVVTEGILTRMLQEDPFLEDVGLVILDEFHERSLDADLALALLQRVRRDVRPDLRLVAMSATLDVDALSAFLGDAPVVASRGRLFPVDVEHAPVRRDDRLEEVVAAAVRGVVAGEPGVHGGERGVHGGERGVPSGGGDVLVFLPGIGEIRRCAAALAPLAAAADVELVELHGDLPPERQDAALEPGARRRVILATNVAETSVTLPGVTTVIDSGLVRRMQLDRATGLDRLELGRVSKASAEQRRGRAGRVAPGRCIRLWSALDQRGLAERETPEIARVDLAGLALALLAFGETDLARFPFLEPPDPAALGHALALLERLGATSGGRLTERGKAMAALPVHPRLARLLLEGAAHGVAERAALAAALLSERDPFSSPRGLAARDMAPERTRGRRVATHESESDVVDRVAALEEFDARGATSFEVGELHRGRGEWLLRSARQIARLVASEDGERRSSGGGGSGARVARGVDDPRGESSPYGSRGPRGMTGSRGGRSDAPTAARDDPDRALRCALFAAYADRLVRRREKGSPRGLMVGGRGVRLAEESAVRGAELFVAVELDGAGDDALVRRASAVEREWLDPAQLSTEDVVRFDAKREAVVALRVTRFADLVVDERTLAAPDPDDAARVLAAAASDDPARALGLAREEIAGFLARGSRLREWMPELELPQLDDAFFRAWLPELSLGARSFAELQKLPLIELLRARLGPRLARAIDQHAPERLTVPSGSAIRLDYPASGPPILAVRIQELFGLAQTPRIAAGRVPVVLHLLAPNHRPQQVTQDLASFWNTTWPKIRGELRARYPRHAWPEDPWNAEAVRGPKRRG